MGEQRRLRIMKLGFYPQHKHELGELSDLKWRYSEHEHVVQGNNMICLPCLLVGARTWVKKLKKHDIHEEEKEDGSAQINNLVELDFFKIFCLRCLAWKKTKLGVLVGIIT